MVENKDASLQHPTPESDSSLQPSSDQTHSEHELETKILRRRSADIGQDENIALTNRHYAMIEATGQDLIEGEEVEKLLRHEILAAHINGVMVGDVNQDFWDPPMPETTEVFEKKLPDDATYQQIEEVHYQGVHIVSEIFNQRFITIRSHLIEQIVEMSPDKSLRLGLKALIYENDDDFFTNIAEYLKSQTHGLQPSPEQHQMIDAHQTEYLRQKRLYERKLKSLDRKFARTITQVSGETINQIHKDFLAGLQDALDLFSKQDEKLSTPIIGLLNEFRKQIKAAPGEEILKAVRKMYILSTFDKDRAGAAFLTPFTLTRALVLGLIKNYWESSGSNIIEFQKKLRTWWVVHVNRPKVLEDGQVVQEVVSPMINSELGSYFTMFTLEDQKLDLLRQSDQVEAVAVLARQQLLSTLVNQDRNQGLDILDGWTHTDMPHQARYSTILHRGKSFKKIFFDHEELQDLDKFLATFRRQFSEPGDWQEFALSQPQIDQAMSGKITIQEAAKRKFDPTDPTSADTSLVLLKEDDGVMPEDIIQRGAQSWTHGSAIKFSLTLFVDEQGNLTGRGAQKGAHSWTDGRVSTIKLQNSLVETTTLLAILAAKKTPGRETIDPSLLTSGAEHLRKEQEAKLQIAQFERQKYQQRIQKLFEFFKKINPPEARFTLDINGIISGAVMITLNDICKISKKKDKINNIQFLERAKYVRSQVQIGDSLTPVPLQFNDGMQESVRRLSAQLEKYQGDIEAMVKGENLSLREVQKQLQRLVLSFAFFDEERKLVRSGNPGIIAVMAEMAGQVRRPLTFASKITSPELTDMAINTVLISSLVPSKSRTASLDTDINIESFSTALDEVYKNFGFVISASSFGHGDNEKVSVVVRQLTETIAPALEVSTQVLGSEVNLQMMIEKNMERILLVLESFQKLYEEGVDQ